MQTYAETKRRPVTNWREELSRPEPDWYKLKPLAQNWTTCACGNLSPEIPRLSEGPIKDSELARLGYAFYHHVQSHQATFALNVLDKIEARAAEILKEQQTN